MSGTGAPIDANKIDLAPWGYAPGNHHFTCGDCTKVRHLDDLHFGHRHATRCATHALEARQNDLRAFTGPMDTLTDDEFAEVFVGSVQATSDRFIRRAFIASVVLAPLLIGAVIFVTP